jgi:4,5-DOPA dioxygenase extradiol
MTHGLPFLTDWSINAAVPGWSADFDVWAGEALQRGDIDTLAAFRTKAPGMPYAHPTVEHFTPLFLTLGTASDITEAPTQVIDGYWLGLAKRSFQVA